MLKRGEQIQGLHEKGQCDLTEVIWTRRMRQIDVYQYPWTVSFTRTLTSLLWPQCPEQYGVHRRSIISVCWLMSKSEGRSSGEYLMKQKWRRNTWRIYTDHLVKLRIMNCSLRGLSQLQNQKHIKQKTKTQNTPQNKTSMRKTQRPERMAQES